MRRAWCSWPCRFTPTAASQDVIRLPLVSTSGRVKQAKHPGFPAVSAEKSSESSDSEDNSVAAFRAVRLHNPASASLLLALLLVSVTVESSASLSSEL
jgi:hypothetical protein